MSTLNVDNLKTLSGNGIDADIVSIGGGQLSNRNKIINGAMQIAQRGTSSTSNGFVSLDRWYNNQSGGSGTFSQETNSNPSETGGIQKYARLNVSSSSDYTGIRQRIEDVTSVPAGTVTLSFYAKGTAPAGGLYVYTTQDFGTGGSSDVDGTPVLVTSSLTSSWVRYTAQISVGSLDGKTINAGSFFQVTLSQGSNSSSTAYDLNITGVQLEVGDTATSFELRSFGDELARCQRYFYMAASGADSSDATVALCYNHSAGSARAVFYFPVTMRTIPDIYEVGGTNYFKIFQAGGTTDLPDSIHGGNERPNMAEMAFEDDVSGLTAGQVSLLRLNNAAARIGFEAEL